ncbi:tRNA (adenosine(37)-N6)-dimethylallyltransferase MiaA [Bacteroidota bacterium]
MSLNKYNLIVIIGPTASGKTSVAANLAYKIDGEIISADSRQVYKKMDLGTGKDYNDYIIKGRKIPYHLIDIHNPGYKYNVFEYQKDFIDVFKKIQKNSKMPILCGGTGLYIESIIKGYKMMPVPPDNKLRAELEQHSLDELTLILSKYKKLHNKTDIDTKKRAVRAIEIEKFHFDHKKELLNFPEIKHLIIGVKYDRQSQRKRITERLKYRIENGMIEEVKGLIESGIDPTDLLYYGLEYKYIIMYILNELSYDEMFTKLNTAIHQFAKRQMTWFRRMERKDLQIQWLDGYMPMDEKIKTIQENLNS